MNNLYTLETLEDMVNGFHHFQKDQFITYVWTTIFSKWDMVATTEEAIQRADDQAELAKQAWNNCH